MELNLKLVRRRRAGRRVPAHGQFVLGLKIVIDVDACIHNRSCIIPPFEYWVLLFINFLIKIPYINLTSALDVTSAQEMAANSLSVAVSSLTEIHRQVILMITTWVLISNVLLFRKGGLFLNREIYRIFWLAYIWIAGTDSNALRFSRSLRFGVIDFACRICVSFSNFILEFSDFHVSGYQQLCSEFFSTSAVAVQGINENYWLCVTTALFTNKAQMNKVLVQWLLVTCERFFISDCLCRSYLTWAPNSIAEADEVARCQYFQVHSTSLRRGKTTWTWLGRQPRVRHRQHAAWLGIRWLSSRQGLSGRLCTSMRLGAAWRLIAGGLCMVPALPGRPRCPVVMVTSTWRYMPLHDDSLHEITCYYMHVIACNYMLLHACNSL